MWWDCLSQSVQFHSLAVGHSKGCEATSFHRMCNVTHKLLVIGQNVMRGLFTKWAMSLTCCCWCDEKIFHKFAMSLTPCWWKEICDERACHKMFNVTDKLLVIGKYLMRTLLINVQSWCCSLAVGHRKRCDEIAFHKSCNIKAHNLLVRGKVMRLPFTKCAMSLTSCWSWKMWWECLSQNVQCYPPTVICVYDTYIRLSFTKCAWHLLAVFHRQGCDETVFHNTAQCYQPAVGHRMRLLFTKICNVTHLLLVIGKDEIRVLCTRCTMIVTSCQS